MSVGRPLNDPTPEDSGPEGVFVVTIMAGGRRKQLSFRSPSAPTLGSGEGCEIRITDGGESISPTHARFVWMNGWLFLEDLGSGHGTVMDGREVKRCLLGAGMRHTVTFGRPGSVTATILVSPTLAPNPEPTSSTDASIQSKHWKDLPPTWPVPATFGRNPAHKLVLKLIESHPEGLTLQELDARLRELGHGRTDSAKLLVWLHDYRGWGFRMDPETSRISVWSFLEYNVAGRLDRRRAEATAAIQRDRKQLEQERRLLLREREQLDQRVRARDLGTASSQPSAHAPWLNAIPEPERDVFQHIANHGQINEAEATALLGGARQFRRFSVNFETLACSCPFKIRIESSGNLKTYVRDE